MKPKSQKNLVSTIYYIVKWVFRAQLLLTSLLILFNYINWFGFFHGEELSFTLRGNVALVEENWKPLVPDEQVEFKTTAGVSPVFLLRKSGFARLNYTDFAQAFSIKNISITILDIIHWAIWLVLTYQLMIILHAIKKSQVFDQSNKFRLKIIGLVFLLAPLISSIKNILFTSVVQAHITVPDHHIPLSEGLSLINHNVLIGLFTMLVIMALSEVFQYGLMLKQENDLTI